MQSSLAWLKQTRRSLYLSCNWLTHALCLRGVGTKLFCGLKRNVFWSALESWGDLKGDENLMVHRLLKAGHRQSFLHSACSLDSKKLLRFSHARKNLPHCGMVFHSSGRFGSGTTTQTMIMAPISHCILLDALFDQRGVFQQTPSTDGWAARPPTASSSSSEIRPYSSCLRLA